MNSRLIAIMTAALVTPDDEEAFVVITRELVRLGYHRPRMKGPMRVQLMGRTEEPGEIEDLGTPPKTPAHRTIMVNIPDEAAQALADRMAIDPDYSISLVVTDPGALQSLGPFTGALPDEDLELSELMSSPAFVNRHYPEGFEDIEEAQKTLDRLARERKSNRHRHALRTIQEQSELSPSLAKAATLFDGMAAREREMMSTKPGTIGALVRALRKRSHLTIGAVARWLEISPANWAEIELHTDITIDSESLTERQARRTKRRTERDREQRYLSIPWSDSGVMLLAAMGDIAKLEASLEHMTGWVMAEARAGRIDTHRVAHVLGIDNEEAEDLLRGM